MNLSGNGKEGVDINSEQADESQGDEGMAARLDEEVQGLSLNDAARTAQHQAIHFPSPVIAFAVP